MNVITIWQPWAQLLVKGYKHYETRSWKTAYRGEILIHSAAKPYSQCERLMSAESRKRIKEVLGLGYVHWREKIPLGVILGKARLTDCRLIDDVFVKQLSSDELLYGDFTPGRYAWVMENLEIFKHPIPVKGKQRIWNWEGSGLADDKNR